MVAVLNEDVCRVVYIGLGQDQIGGGIVDGGSGSFDKKQLDLFDGLADISGS